jgi:TusA-related sulfurtransferase
MSTRETRLEARAIEQRWAMSPEMRKAVINRLLKVVADPTSKKREVIAAAKALMAAEKQNQEDEHKVVDIEIQTRNAQLDSIAADLGIEVSAIEDAERQSGSNFARIENQPGEEADA